MGRIFIHFFLLLSAVILMLTACDDSTGNAVAITGQYSFNVNNDTLPVYVSVVNKMTNVKEINWRFEGAESEMSSDLAPQNVKFNQRGIYKVYLTATNDISRVQEVQQINLYKDIVVNFEFKPDTLDRHYELLFINKTREAKYYKWSFEKAFPSFSTEVNPSGIKYYRCGTYNIVLEASNDYQKKEVLSKAYKVNLPINTLDIVYHVEKKEEKFAVIIDSLIPFPLTAEWTFEGGSMDTQKKMIPDTVFYSLPGSYDIKLSASNYDTSLVITKRIVLE